MRETIMMEYFRSGTAQSNSDTILKLEPEIMHKLKFHLTIHAPFRPFEGHLIDMKTRSLLGFDLEQVRPHSSEFFKVNYWTTIFFIISIRLISFFFFILSSIVFPSSVFYTKENIAESAFWRCYASISTFPNSTCST